MRRTILSLSVTLSFMKIFVAQLLELSESSSVIYLQVCRRRKNLIQPPEEPQRQHLGEFQQRTSKLFNMDPISLFII